MERRRIFNHNLTDSIPNKIYNHDFSTGGIWQEDDRSISEKLGFGHYPGRVLGLTRDGDILQLPPDLKKHWDWIKQHYYRCGISHTKEVIWDDDYAVMRDYPNHGMSVFFFGEKAHQARPDIERYNIVKKMNAKNMFIDFCEKEASPTLLTWCFACKTDFEKPQRFPFPVYLKISESLSGLGVVLCDDHYALKRQVELLDKECAFQVQKKEKFCKFLNLQYKVYP